MPFRSGTSIRTRRPFRVPTLVVLLSVLWLSRSPVEAQLRYFQRSDADTDGSVQLSDALRILFDGDLRTDIFRFATAGGGVEVMRSLGSRFAGASVWTWASACTREAEIIRLHKLEGKTFEEIAGLWEKKPGAVQRFYSRALERFREAVARGGTE